MQPRRRDLPDPSQSFTEKKTKILEQLAVPDSEYTDLSPKGTVDKGIRHLIDEINSTDGFVTTSSCAGRVSVFLEGRKAPLATDSDTGADADADAEGEDARSSSQVAGVGGKGAGGTWLYVSHDPVLGTDWTNSLDLSREDDTQEQDDTRRLVHFKFEPMVSFKLRVLSFEVRS
jgi:tRNA wybutosine-synthesizing protein 3